MERGICDATTRATGDERAGSVPLTARPDHRHETRIGEAGTGDRLAFSGGEVRGGVHRQAGPAAIADAADGGAPILKHTYDLSDEALCDRWVENPYFQYFCGEEFFQHALVFDRSSLTRWRQRMGEEKLPALLQESLAVATRTDAMKPSDLARVVIDTTVQPKAVMFPTDAKLLNRARERLVRLTKKLGVSLRQSYARVGKLALINTNPQ